VIELLEVSFWLPSVLSECRPTVKFTQHLVPAFNNLPNHIPTTLSNGQRGGFENQDNKHVSKRRKWESENFRM